MRAINSSEMATVVETFLIEETQELIYDNDKLARWNKLVNELGLEGQSQIVKDDKSPIPFLHMKQSLVTTMETLCPMKVLVSAYNKTPIPVDIMELIGLSVKEQYFDRIEVWYDDKSPDPCVVGILAPFKLYHYTGVPKDLPQQLFPNKAKCLEFIKNLYPNFDETLSFGYETDKANYLIGKWADMKHSFAQLREMAKERFIRQETARCQQQIKYYQNQMSELSVEAENKFN